VIALKMSYKKTIKKTGKILLYIIGSVLVLACLFLVFINTSIGKRVVKNRIQSYLEDKFKSKVRIGSIDYSLPKWIEINSVYIEDKQKDTLVYGEHISVDISMLKLMSGNTDIQKLVFKNIFLNVTGMKMILYSISNSLLMHLQEIRTRQKWIRIQLH
jgi:translocation and assembly module TamB